MIETNNYELMFGRQEFIKAEDSSDLLTEFSQIVDDVCFDWVNYKYDRTQRNFVRGTSLSLKHKTARPLLYGLNSDVRQFILFWPHEKDRAILENIFSQERRGHKVSKSYLNELHTKITNCKKLINYLIKKYSLRIRRHFFYEDNYLNLTWYKSAYVRPGTMMDTVAQSLFSSPYKVWKNHDFIDHIRKEVGAQLYTVEWDTIPDQIKNACVALNRSVSRNLKEPYSFKLFKHDKKITKINTDYFHIIYRK